MVEIKANCLCGQIKITAKAKNKTFDACHCRVCRKWNGSPAMSIESESLEITNKDSLKLYDSSEWAERGFCNHCGTHLFYHLKGGNYWIQLGIVENNEEFEFSHQIFIDHKPKNYDFANQTQLFTEAEFLSWFSENDKK